MIVKLEYETLLRIKVILEEFGLMSGLICNVEKTSLLPIGTQMRIDDRIRDLGFTIAEKITVLGLEIDGGGTPIQTLTKSGDKYVSTSMLGRDLT
jgi:Fe2+ transport system protein FeoA